MGRTSAVLVLALTVAAAPACVRRYQVAGDPDAPTYRCSKDVFGRSSTCKPVSKPRPKQVQRAPVGSAPTTRSRTGKLRAHVPYAGGRLEVSSPPGRGTVVEVALPVSAGRGT